MGKSHNVPRSCPISPREAKIPWGCTSESATSSMWVSPVSNRIPFAPFFLAAVVLVWIIEAVFGVSVDK